jgi:elongation factor G
MKPQYLIQVAVQVRLHADKSKLQQAIAELISADASLSCVTDEESGVFVLRGFSVKALDLAVHLLKAHAKFEIEVGALQVAYRETFTKEVTVDYTHKRQAHGKGEFARVKIRFIPIEVNEPLHFEHAPDLAISADFIRGVERGVASVADAGQFARFPLQGIKSVLIDAAWHSEDSSEKAFEIAARAAMREAAHDGSAALLEPIMRIKIAAPERHRRDIEADIRLRRGEIIVWRVVGEDVKLEALVPLCMLFKYEDALRTMTLGHCSFEMEFSRYALLPTDPPRPPAAAMYAA